MAKSKTSVAKSFEADGRLYHLPLSELHVDRSNPRFGDHHLSSKNESKVVDEIIGQHGILDVISSIAANGYFASEPLVGAINRGHNEEVTVIEGNRRLTACLVLAGDERASNHAKLRSQYPDSKFTARSKLPVQVYDWANAKHRAQLLPYLGVRHIVGAQQWDSYAKAAWVVATLDASELQLDDIKKMIGDDQNFTSRIVEGYHFVRQLIDTSTYDSDSSLRKGRGSLQQFPFSWVYTALGYRSVREFLELPSDPVLTEQPIKVHRLDEAGDLMRFMFGGNGKHAAIKDSREIGDLARALSHSVATAVLKNGGSISEALDATRPQEQLLIDLLGRADKSLAEGVKIASGIGPLERGSIDSINDFAERIGGRLEALLSIIKRGSASARVVSKRPRKGDK